VAANGRSSFWNLIQVKQSPDRGRGPKAVRRQGARTIAMAWPKQPGHPWRKRWLMVTRSSIRYIAAALTFGVGPTEMGTSGPCNRVRPDTASTGCMPPSVST
jgi:hypothetical protein